MSGNKAISLQLLDLVTNEKKYVYVSISGASFICLEEEISQRPLLSINLNNAQLIPTKSRSRGIAIIINIKYLLIIPLLLLAFAIKTSDGSINEFICPTNSIKTEWVSLIENVIETCSSISEMQVYNPEAYNNNNSINDSIMNLSAADDDDIKSDSIINNGSETAYYTTPNLSSDYLLNVDSYDGTSSTVDHLAKLRSRSPQPNRSSEKSSPRKKVIGLCLDRSTRVENKGFYDSKKSAHRSLSPNAIENRHKVDSGWNPYAYGKNKFNRKYSPERQNGTSSYKTTSINLYENISPAREEKIKQALNLLPPDVRLSIENERDELRKSRGKSFVKTFSNEKAKKQQRSLDNSLRKPEMDEKQLLEYNIGEYLQNTTSPQSPSKRAKTPDKDRFRNNNARTPDFKFNDEQTPAWGSNNNPHKLNGRSSRDRAMEYSKRIKSPGWKSRNETNRTRSTSAQKTRSNHKEKNLERIARSVSPRRDRFASPNGNVDAMIQEELAMFEALNRQARNFSEPSFYQITSPQNVVRNQTNSNLELQEDSEAYITSDAAEWKRTSEWLEAIGMKKWNENFLKGGATKLSIVELMLEEDLTHLGIDDKDIPHIMKCISDFSIRTKDLTKEAMSLDNNDMILSPTSGGFPEIDQSPDTLKSPSVRAKISASLLVSFDNCSYDEFFFTWNATLPNLINTDSESKASYFARRTIEFQLHVYFMAYSIKNIHPKHAIEKTSATFSEAVKNFSYDKTLPFINSSDFVLYAGLPLVPNPLENPMYSKLFDDAWASNLRQRLIIFFHIMDLCPPVEISVDRLLKDENKESDKNSGKVNRRASKHEVIAEIGTNTYGILRGRGPPPVIAGTKSPVSPSERKASFTSFSPPHRRASSASPSRGASTSPSRLQLQVDSYSTALKEELKSVNGINGNISNFSLKKYDNMYNE